MCHFSYFNRKIINPIKNYGYQGEGENALRSLKNDILDKILLRRTKVERAEDICLPSLSVRIRRDALSADERDFYEGLFKQTKIQFNTYVEAGTLLHNFAHIFDLLSRLRQAVDHPYLIVYGKLKMNALDSLTSSSFAICGICQSTISAKEIVEAHCNHPFHFECIKEYMDAAPTTASLLGEESSSFGDLGCPVCYVPLSLDFSKKMEELKKKEDTSLEETEAEEVFQTGEEENFQLSPAISLQKLSPKNRGIVGSFDADTFTSSTKIEALYQELLLLEEKDKTSKSLIFSQYCSMLELISWRLKKGGIRCAQYTGSISLVSRCNILYAFNTDPTLKVLLISLKAGGEGLNLQVANSIFLMDPWWNPAAEMQAIQRAHRIGQTKDVQAVRFICKDTIEERILHLQEKKQLVFDGTIGANASAIMKLTTDDLRFLFQN
ncbi:SWI2/SNF2-containing protein RAD16 [Cardiosporidium cionae]|uniref:SWI2/SNF2-containing protein RAD16 n=1 Tax=Cardiosporidium cionae TaxID=476202 RepID=A0ABQ7J5M6_9APIC|nr:SWI2/SNF2-containing protein RAD16 [Cardiosporidium cionae]|eukprot:KAF8819291.1 SWI2/SNF2-containing protein RAD16 [Cardiosporidium cionae]